MITLVKRICKQCYEEFEVMPAEIKRGNGLFCSKECAHDATKQYHEFECVQCKNKYKLTSGQIKQRGFSKKFCSPECKSVFRQSNSLRFCKVCGKNIKLYPSQIKNGQGNYCSQECRDESQRKKETHICKNCGKNYEVNYHSRKSKFCSQDCAMEYFNTNEDILRKRYGGLCKKPTLPERIVIDIIKENKLPYKYVGDGSVIISNLNPDFIHCNGDKKIIEVFGDYWHRDYVADWNRTEEGRKQVFQKEGYEILIIWESDIKKNCTDVLKTIMAFEKL